MAASCVTPQNPSSSAIIMSKALSIDIENSSLDVDTQAREEKKTVQNFLTLDRIDKENRMPKDRCHSQAAKRTMNHDRESDINIKVACLKADRSLGRIDNAKEDIDTTIRDYKKW